MFCLWHILFDCWRMARDDYDGVGCTSDLGGFQTQLSRSARQYEEIKIWSHQVVVRKVSPSGKTIEHLFNPFWTKFDVQRHEEFGVTAMKLREKERVLEVGSFLNPADRTSFANAFALALAKVRH